MLFVVLILLLSLHLLAVNVAAGAPLVGVWLDWRGTRGNDLAAQGAVFLAKATVHGLLAGALLGVLVGWLKWDAAYQELWTGPLSYKRNWAIGEAIFSLVLFVAWWRWLPGAAGGSKTAMRVRSLLALISATNLLYHFPALLSVAARLHRAGNRPDLVLKGASFRALALGAETPALALHVALAAIATGGVVLLWFAVRSTSPEADEERTRLARSAGWWALVPSLLQLPVGLWTLMRLAPDAQSQLMGQNTVGTLLLVASLLAAFWLINDLVQIALGEPTKGLIQRTFAALLITVILMTAMQQQTRGPVPAPATATPPTTTSLPPPTTLP